MDEAEGVQQYGDYLRSITQLNIQKLSELASSLTSSQNQMDDSDNNDDVPVFLSHARKVTPPFLRQKKGEPQVISSFPDETKNAVFNIEKNQKLIDEQVEKMEKQVLNLADTRRRNFSARPDDNSPSDKQKEVERILFLRKQRKEIDQHRPDFLVKTEQPRIPQAPARQTVVSTKPKNDKPESGTYDNKISEILEKRKTRTTSIPTTSSNSQAPIEKKDAPPKSTETSNSRSNILQQVIEKRQKEQLTNPTPIKQSSSATQEKKVEEKKVEEKKVEDKKVEEKKEEEASTQNVEVDSDSESADVEIFTEADRTKMDSLENSPQLENSNKVINENSLSFEEDEEFEAKQEVEDSGMKDDDFEEQLKQLYAKKDAKAASSAVSATNPVTSTTIPKKTETVVAAAAIIQKKEPEKPKPSKIEETIEEDDEKSIEEEKPNIQKIEANTKKVEEKDDYPFSKQNEDEEVKEDEEEQEEEQETVENITAMFSKSQKTPQRNPIFLAAKNESEEENAQEMEQVANEFLSVSLSAKKKAKIIPIREQKKPQEQAIAKKSQTPLPTPQIVADDSFEDSLSTFTSNRKLYLAKNDKEKKQKEKNFQQSLNYSTILDSKEIKPSESQKPTNIPQQQKPAASRSNNNNPENLNGSKKTFFPIFLYLEDEERAEGSEIPKISPKSAVNSNMNGALNESNAQKTSKNEQQPFSTPIDKSRMNPRTSSVKKPSYQYLGPHEEEIEEISAFLKSLSPTKSKSALSDSSSSLRSKFGDIFPTPLSEKQDFLSQKMEKTLSFENSKKFSLSKPLSAGITKILEENYNNEDVLQEESQKGAEQTFKFLKLGDDLQESDKIKETEAVFGEDQVKKLFKSSNNSLSGKNFEEKAKLFQLSEKRKHNFQAISFLSPESMKILSGTFKVGEAMEAKAKKDSMPPTPVLVATQIVQTEPLAGVQPLGQQAKEEIENKTAKPESDDTDISEAESTTADTKTKGKGNQTSGKGKKVVPPPKKAVPPPKDAKKKK